MIRIAALLSIALFACLSVPAQEPAAFDRYKIIFQKFPFGEPPKVVEAAPTPPVVTKPDWIKDYRLSMLKEKSDGRKVAGLVKKTDNSSIILSVGQTHPVDGIQLVSIDTDAGEVSLKKGNEVQVLAVNPDDYMANRKTASASRGKPGSKPGAGSASSKYKDFAQRMAERRAELAKKAASQKKGAPKPAPRPSGR